MAGKRSAREVLDEWQAKMNGGIDAGVDAVQEATGTGGIVNEAKFAYKHPTLAAGKDAIGLGGIANSAGMAAGNAAQGAGDIYDQVQAGGQQDQGMMQQVQQILSQLPAQIQQQASAALQSGQITAQDFLQKAQQMISGQPAEGSTQGIINTGNGYVGDGVKPPLPPQGLLDKGAPYDMPQGGSYADAPAQQAAPPAQVDPDRAASEQVIMQKLMSMSPEERNALVQKLQQQAGGMQ
jgi:hypothetical protein